MGESNECMSHQCNASTLGGGTEKSNTDFPAFKVGSIVLDGSPSPGPNRLFELMHSGQMHLKSSIHLYEAKETNLEQWDPSRAKLPTAFSAGPRRESKQNAPDAFTPHGLGLLIEASHQPPPVTWGPFTTVPTFFRKG